VIIDQEISKVIEEQYQRAIKILEQNKDKLSELAEILLEKEVIFKDDLEKIFGARPFIKEEAVALKSNTSFRKEKLQEETQVETEQQTQEETGEETKEDTGEETKSTVVKE